MDSYGYAGNVGFGEAGGGYAGGAIGRGCRFRVGSGVCVGVDVGSGVGVGVEYKNTSFPSKPSKTL